MNVAFSQLERHARAHDFSGVVRVQRRGEVLVEFACGHSDRANERVNNLETRFAVASGTKALTALTIMSLVESGAFTLDTTLRSVVPGDLPHVDEAVTIDHLLTHRSGVVTIWTRPRVATSTTTYSVRSLPTPSRRLVTTYRC